MQIRLRHIDDTNSVLFTECRIDHYVALVNGARAKGVRA